jgi:hypothetical protein
MRDWHAAQVIPVIWSRSSDVEDAWFWGRERGVWPPSVRIDVEGTVDMVCSLEVRVGKDSEMAGPAAGASTPRGNLGRLRSDGIAFPGEDGFDFPTVYLSIIEIHVDFLSIDVHLYAADARDGTEGPLDGALAMIAGDVRRFEDLSLHKDSLISPDPGWVGCSGSKTGREKAPYTWDRPDADVIGAGGCRNVFRSGWKGKTFL